MYQQHMVNMTLDLWQFDNDLYYMHHMRIAMAMLGRYQRNMWYKSWNHW
jgi:hypothetical protein